VNNRTQADAGIETASDFANLIARIESSPETDSRLAAAALAAVRAGVITGEGPTTAGRIHFSRAIDPVDTATIRRILLAGNTAVTRAEADALFDIHEAALERTDHGAFDDLLVKAIAHHVLGEAGKRVPPRETALDAEIALAEWADLDAGTVKRDVAVWLKNRLGRRRRSDGVLAALIMLTGTAAAWGSSIAAAIDFAA
jgi:hypothetical protein